MIGTGDSPSVSTISRRPHSRPDDQSPGPLGHRRSVGVGAHGASTPAGLRGSIPPAAKAGIGPLKALITGAGGFVGPHLARHLRTAGDEVVCFDLESGPDLRDSEAWIAAIGDHQPDVVYHLAGWSDVGGSWHDPITTFEVNTMGTISILEAVRQAGAGRVLLISSADVYGVVTPDVLPLTEEHPVRPRSPYGASKQAAEAAALQYRRGSGVDVVVARPFNHLGPGQAPRFVAPSFAAQIARAESGGSRRLEHGDLSPHRDLTDVRDVVRAYRLLAEQGESGEIYNVCSGRTVSMQELLDALLSLSEVRVEQAVDPALVRPVDLPVLRGSFAKLRATTGWEPEIHLDDTLASVLADARNDQRLGLTSH